MGGAISSDQTPLLELQPSHHLPSMPPSCHSQLQTAQVRPFFFEEKQTSLWAAAAHLLSFLLRAGMATGAQVAPYLEKAEAGKPIVAAR